MARAITPEACGEGRGGTVAFATIYAGPAPGANTDIFTAKSVGPRCVALRITVSLATGSVFDLRVTDGSTAYTQHLNAGAALTASCLYTFTVGARRYSTQTGTTELTYSCRVATDGVIQTLFIEEVTGPVV